MSLANGAWAEENDLSEILNRCAILEDEQRELRGLVENLQHQVEVLSQKIEEQNLRDAQDKIDKPQEEMPLKAEKENLENELKVEALPETDKTSVEDPQELYSSAQSFLEGGDYVAAEKILTTFLKAHPKHTLAGNAQYWLGITYSVQGQHERAAAAFAKGYKEYPKSEKAADNVLRLAQSLAKIKKKSDACTALEHLSDKYGKTHKKVANQERQKLKCP